MRFTVTFKKFMISYLLILILPMITGFIIYRISINLAISSSITNSFSVLKQSELVLDQRMNEIGNFTRQFAFNNDVIELLNLRDSDKKSSVFLAWNISKDLLSYATTNDYLQNCYLYIKRDQTVITPKSVFYRDKDFYSLNNYSHNSFLDWKKNVLEKNHNGDFIPLTSKTNGAHTTINYVQSLPLNSFNQPIGTLVVQINENQFDDLLTNFEKLYGGWAYITDQDGNTLAKNGISNRQIKNLNLRPWAYKKNTHRFLNNDTLLITSYSPHNGWYYVAGIPKSSLLKSANIVKRMSLWITLLTLILGGFICLVFAIKNSGPIHGLVLTVKEHLGLEGEKLKDEYRFLQGNIGKLLSQNKSLENKLSHQLPILKETYLKRLIQGDVYSIDEIREINEHFGSKPQNYGYVGILKFNGYLNKIHNNELAIARLLTKDTLMQLDQNIQVTNYSVDQLVFIYWIELESKAKDLQKIRNEINSITQCIEEKYQFSITIAIGSMFETLEDVNQSFQDSKQLMDYSVLMNQSGLFWHDEFKKETIIYKYTIDQELQIINALKTGEASTAKALLDGVFEENFSENQLSIEMALQLINEIKATLLKTLDIKRQNESSELIALQTKLKSLESTDRLEQIHQLFNQAIEEICCSFNKKKIELDNAMIRIIKEFLEDNYGDANLTLNEIAEKLDLQEKYVAQMFKQQTGMYLMEYLEKIRMKKAAQFLIETEMKIEDIGCTVGYNSSHSFRRAFKRMLNVTPNQYRKAINGNLIQQ
ncbi:AraC family transcriptional regulator [Pullulanibacillus sp. KACC 23026]|uniref:AraC family transcriptional regulator n=1 Tax=Pullulanibacillus sp. KACC 23026 TaxID=3028315 RepID=UPI0023AEA41D|nr:AraC family transcriptional regulator [Pullulanibacillus sp. KACC 23026]WEG11079.1 AraC family transcriptional regulator [Pullulanibacillus sp. KACC 23026]